MRVKSWREAKGKHETWKIEVLLRNDMYDCTLHIHSVMSLSPIFTVTSSYSHFGIYVNRHMKTKILNEERELNCTFIFSLLRVRDWRMDRKKRKKQIKKSADYKLVFWIFWKTKWQRLQTFSDFDSFHFKSEISPKIFNKITQNTAILMMMMMMTSWWHYTRRISLIGIDEIIQKHIHILYFLKSI